MSFSCSLDGGAYEPCSSPKAYSGLAQGHHSFRVRARDAAGNDSAPSAPWVWFADTIDPNRPTLTQTPPDPTSSQSATFAWTDTDPAPGSGIAAYLCRLDGNLWLPCSSPRTYAGLSLRSHTFRVVAIDWAANISNEAGHTWTVSAGGLPFTITGGAPAGVKLYPGGAAVPVDLVFINPNGAPIMITGVEVTISGTSAAGCAAGDFTVDRQLVVTPALVVPGDATRSLSQLDANQDHWPKLRMIDNGDQDACQDATVDLAFTGEATG